MWSVGAYSGALLGGFGSEAGSGGYLGCPPLHARWPCILDAGGASAGTGATGPIGERCDWGDAVRFQIS